MLKNLKKARKKLEVLLVRLGLAVLAALDDFGLRAPTRIMPNRCVNAPEQAD